MGILSRLVLALTSFTASLAMLEAIARHYFPFPEVKWPTQFSPRVGFTFVPHSQVRWSNFIDFSSVQTANSLGFLDDEPPTAPKASDEYRVVFIGDSFVEAAQVPIAHKVHRLVERELNNQGISKRVSVSAFGYSGAGTASELPFYTEFARPLTPDLVVLVFIRNDLANNSALLEAIRNGWSPHKAPRPAYEIRDAQPYLLPIAADWQSEVDPDPSERMIPLWKYLGDTYLKWSALYRWGAARAFWNIKIEETAHTQVERIGHLRSIPEFAQKLAGWRYPEDLDLDLMFFAKSMPEAFTDALTFTRAALQTLKHETTRDNAKLVVLIDQGCYQTDTDLKELRTERAIEPELLGRRVERILNELEIPFINFREALNMRGIDTVSYSHDGHWSEIGHREAARALIPFIKDSIR